MARSVRAFTVQVVAAGLLIMAATVLPWATYRENQAKVMTAFRGGPISVVLVCLAIASIGLSLWLFARSSVLLHRVDVAVGCAALVGSVALALGKIHMANQVANAQEGGGQTSYAMGAGVAILASVTLVVMSAIRLSNVTASSPKKQSGV